MSLTFNLWAQLYILPLIVTCILWGGLTVGLLWINRQGVRVARLCLLAALPIMVLAHHQLWAVRFDLSTWGAYRAFLAGMLVWTWHELAFYSGILTGPWRAPCPADAVGWRRFWYALGTHLYHEAGVLVELALLAWFYQGATNPLGLLTFGLLWTLQHSAKLNVLLGIRSLQVEMLPAHLRYLGSFWTQRSHNPFFLPSVITTSILALVCWLQASLLDTLGVAVGMALLASLTTLGVLEHWLLVLPSGASQQREIKPPRAADISRLKTDT